MKNTIKFTNPRRHAVIENWPSGGNRVVATFSVESDPKKGERVSRTTTGKPHKTTYDSRCVIADGDDGKTYILTESPGCVKIIPGTMKVGTQYIWDGSDNHDQYLEIKSLIEQGCKV